MSPELEMFEKYQHLAKITVGKLFPEKHIYANSIRLQFDDLLQFALIGLWVGCNTIDKNKHSLKAHLIRNIKWNVLREVQKQKSQFQLYKSKSNLDGNMVNVISIDMPISNELDNDLSFEDITSSDNIFTFESETPEKTLMSSLGKDSILKLLKPKDLKLVRLRLDEGLTYQQIADMYGVKRQAIGFRFKKLQEKVNRHMGVATV